MNVVEGSENLLISRSHVLDIFFVYDSVKCNMPDGNVEALAMGSTFPSIRSNHV